MAPRTTPSAPKIPWQRRLNELLEQVSLHPEPAAIGELLGELTELADEVGSFQPSGDADPWHMVWYNIAKTALPPSVLDQISGIIPTPSPGRWSELAGVAYESRCHTDPTDVLGWIVRTQPLDWSGVSVLNEAAAWVPKYPDVPISDRYAAALRTEMLHLAASRPPDRSWWLLHDILLLPSVCSNAPSHLHMMDILSERDIVLSLATNVQLTVSTRSGQCRTGADLLRHVSAMMLPGNPNMLNRLCSAAPAIVARWVSDVISAPPPTSSTPEDLKDTQDWHDQLALHLPRTIWSIVADRWTQKAPVLTHWPSSTPLGALVHNVLISRHVTGAHVPVLEKPIKKM